MDKLLQKEKSAVNFAVVLFAIVFPTFVTLVYFVWLSDAAPSVQQIAYAIGKTVQFTLPVVWVWFFFRYRFKRNSGRSQSAEGASGAKKIPNWLWAVGFGLDVCIVMAIAYWVLSGSELMAGMTQELKVKVAGLGVDNFWKYAMLGVFYALVHSFLEEYYWRWFVYDLLKRFVSVPQANVISSLGFMAHHVVLLSVYFGWASPMTWLCSIGVAIGGVFWAWLYEKSGTLVWPWISHMIVDAGIFSLGYFLVF